MHKINSNFSSLADALSAIVKEAPAMQQQQHVTTLFYYQASKIKSFINRAGGNWFLCRFFVGQTLFELTYQDCILIADYLTSYARLYGRALDQSFIHSFTLNLQITSNAN